MHPYPTMGRGYAANTLHKCIPWPLPWTTGALQVPYADSMCRYAHNYCVSRSRKPSSSLDTVRRAPLHCGGPHFMHIDEVRQCSQESTWPSFSPPPLIAMYLKRTQPENGMEKNSASIKSSTRAASKEVHLLSLHTQLAARCNRGLLLVRMQSFSYHTLPSFLLNIYPSGMCR